MNTKFTEKFFDECIDAFYKDVGPDFRNRFMRGQLFWTHVYYAYENLELWRPKDLDETKTYSAEFVITSSKIDAFNRRTPLYTPRLEINEEFIVIRAKRRPVVLLAPKQEIINTKKIKGGRKVNLNLCVVAPLYSVVDQEGSAKYSQDFIDRIRKLEFPHLFFFSENQNKGIRPSICRLDCIQVCFVNHMEALDLCLDDEVLNVFLGQVRFYFGGIYEGDYEIYRELLLNQN